MKTITEVLLILVVSVSLLPGCTWVAADPNQGSGQGESSGGQAADSDSRKAILEIVRSLKLVEDSGSEVPRTYSGTIVASRKSSLGFQQSGRLDKVLVDQGERVTEGQILAELDAAELGAELDVMQAELAAAVAQMEELEAGPRKQTVEAAKQKLAEMLAMRDQAKSLFLRRSRLVGSDAIAVQDIDDAKHELAAAQGRLMAQREIVAELEEGTRPEQLAAQQAVLEKLRASIKRLEVLSEQTQLKAPYDGVVAVRMMDEGAIVSPGAVVLRVLETSSPEAWVGMPVEAIEDLDIDDNYSLSVDGQEYIGKVQAILPELDQATRTQTVVFRISVKPRREIDSTQEVFVPTDLGIGQLVRLNVTQSVEQSGFWLPISALTRSARGLWSIYAIEETDLGFEVDRREIEVLQIDSNRIFVRGTIEAGDNIVSSGTQKLTNGQRVRIAE